GDPNCTVSSRDPGRDAADRDRLDDYALKRVDPRDRMVVGVRDPDSALANGDLGGRRADLDLFGDLSCRGIDQTERVRVDLRKRLRGAAEDEHKHARSRYGGNGARACDDEPAASPELRPPERRPLYVGRREPRKHLPETVNVELVDVLRPVEILEAMLAQVP